jgi:hypothetical protein
MLRSLGGWIALTPELDAKLLLGRHVWDNAQHADLWGKRLPELRAPAQQSEPANDAFVRFMDLVDSPDRPGQTLERLAGIYRVLKPHLITVYERHLAVANPVYEPPTRRILLRCLEEERRHVGAGAVVLGRLTYGGEAARRVEAWETTLGEALAQARGVTGDVEPPLISPSHAIPDATAVAQDLVNVPPPFDPAEIEPDLLASIGAHASELRRVAGPFDRWWVVALAKIGRYRVVKIRVAGPIGASVLQALWKPANGGWRLASADVLQAPAGD